MVYIVIGRAFNVLFGVIPVTQCPGLPFYFNTLAPPKYWQE